MPFQRSTLRARFVHFNDTRCDSVAELRSVILKARRLAHDDAEQERAAAAVKTWLLAQIQKNGTLCQRLSEKRHRTNSAPAASPPSYRSQACAAEQLARQPSEDIIRWPVSTRVGQRQEQSP